MVKKKSSFRFVKMTFTGIAGFSSLAICGYLLYFFHTVPFLPLFLSLTLRALCLILAISTLVIMLIQIENLK